MFDDGGFHMGGMHGLWWIFWVVLIGALIFSIRGLTGQRRRETPREVLQRRLADGEIDAEEYEKRNALLNRDAGKTG